jgi:hypothetical protein
MTCPAVGGRSGSEASVPRSEAVSGVHRRYPLRDVALYNGVTLLHFGVATLGLLVAYDRWPVVAWVLAMAYLIVALGQMYVVMPLVVCSACVYTTMPGARCVSGMNVVAARLGLRAPAGSSRPGGPRAHSPTTSSTWARSSRPFRCSLRG